MTKAAACANPWMSLVFDSMQLAMESQTVIGLRVMKAFAGGPRAEAEASRMISEKMEAAMAVQTQLITTGLTTAPHISGAKAIATYRKTVRANRTRLLSGG